MVKQSPGVWRILIMVAFALSCFGLLLFLWNAFGGPSPLQPRGYEFKVAFPDAAQLTPQAEVRISGVPVGKVVKLAQGPDRTIATIEMKEKFAPVHTDARAILRQKTLIGETYVEITPGTRSAPRLPENARLADSRVAKTTQLDEVLRTFDAKTRADFRQFLVGWSKSIDGRGQDISDVVGNLGPTARSGASLLSILDTQRSALATLVRDTGTTFGALGRQEGATRTLITSGDRVFAETARRDSDLQETLRVLPTFLRELNPTLRTVQATAVDAAPLVRQLKPAAPLVRPVLRDTIDIAPTLQTFFRRLDPIITQSRTALPAATRTLNAAGPLVDQLAPLSGELVPVTEYVSKYTHEIMQSWANAASATQATAIGGTGKPIHYVRVLVPLTNELLYGTKTRANTNRHNPYLAPGGIDIAGGVSAIDCPNLGNGPPIPKLGDTGPCKQEKPTTFSGQALLYPHLRPSPPTATAATR